MRFNSGETMKLIGPKYDLDLLLRHFKYGEEDNPIQFTLLNDFEAFHKDSTGNQKFIPMTETSKAAIRDAVTNVMTNIPPRSNVLFYFGGHAIESLGNQSIISGDGQRISGSEIQSWLSNTSDPTGSVTAVFDACHSGGSLGLPFNYETTSDGIVKVKKVAHKKQSIPMIQISAARPDQVAYSVGSKEGYYGQLTFGFVQYLKTPADPTIESLVSYLYKHCDPSGTQLPQVSASRKIYGPVPFFCRSEQQV
ncbi:hypothetical protein FRC04_003941 [Tulasnella sp. 424]|nr:hypothetical protein FRC04_003941 [Tulasnella sp. 424]